MAYARNGIKLGPVDISGYDVIIKDSKGKAIPEGAKGDNPEDGVFYATWVSGGVVSGGVIQKLATGRYTVDVMKGTKVLARGIFVVVDTQKLPTVSIKKLRTEEDNEIDAFLDCFTVKIGDDEITTGLAPIFETTNTPIRAYAKEVYVLVDVGDNVLILKANVAKYVTVPIEFDGYTAD
jgi:hypothetical protein